MSRFRAFALGVSLLLIACGKRGLPSDSYDWNPALKKTQGKLDPWVSSLPLGSAEVIEHAHPLDPEDDTIQFSNANGLMPFIVRQEPALASAAAFYEKDGSVSGAAYAALIAKDRAPVIAKKSLYVGDSSVLLSPGATLTLHVRGVRGLLPADGPCRLFVVVTNGVGAMVQGGDYVVLAGSRKNLYLEIVVSGTLAESDSAAPSYDLERPFDAKDDWAQESLKAVVRAHAKTELDVCQLPS